MRLLRPPLALLLCDAELLILLAKVLLRSKGQEQGQVIMFQGRATLEQRHLVSTCHDAWRHVHCDILHPFNPCLLTRAMCRSMGSDAPSGRWGAAAGLRCLRPFACPHPGAAAAIAHSVQVHMLARVSLGGVDGRMLLAGLRLVACIYHGAAVIDADKRMPATCIAAASAYAAALGVSAPRSSARKKTQEVQSQAESKADLARPWQAGAAALENCCAL